jgi:hypothetical protein
VPEIEAPRDEPHAPETASEDTASGNVPPEPQEPAESRSWLYRFFFGEGSRRS